MDTTSPLLKSSLGVREEQAHVADPTFPPHIPVNVNNMPVIDVPLFHGLVGLSGADAHSHHIDLRDERRRPGDLGFKTSNAAWQLLPPACDPRQFPRRPTERNAHTRLPHACHTPATRTQLCETAPASARKNGLNCSRGKREAGV